MADIDIQQIEAFLAVARCQNISRAAHELYISQSSISNRIMKMESDCGLKLFNRTNRGVSLTYEGELLYARLDIAYHRFRVSVNEICRGSENNCNILRIGYLNRLNTIETAEKLISQYISAFPDKKIVYEMFNFHELRYKLMCGELDLAFSVEYDVSQFGDFQYAALTDMPGFFYIPREWMPTCNDCELSSVLGGKVLILESPTAKDISLSICKEYGIIPSKIRYVDTYILEDAAVSRGDGFSIDGMLSKANEYYYPPAAVLPANRMPYTKTVAFWRDGEQTHLAGHFLHYALHELI